MQQQKGEERPQPMSEHCGCSTENAGTQQGADRGDVTGPEKDNIHPGGYTSLIFYHHSLVLMP